MIDYNNWQSVQNNDKLTTVFLFFFMLSVLSGDNLHELSIFYFLVKNKMMMIMMMI